MTIFEPYELATYLGIPPADLDEARANLLTQLAEGEIEDVTGVLDPWPSRAVTVAFEVVARAYRNPEGLSLETIDDYTKRRDAAAAGIYLTDQERARLSRLPGGAAALPRALRCVRVSLGQLMIGLLASGRAAAERLMTDTCVIRRRTGTTENADGVVTDVTTVIYSGKCRVQLRGLVGRDADVGDQPVALAAAELQLPAATRTLRTDDVATITASSTSPATIGARWRIQDAENRKTHETSYRPLVRSLPWESS